MIPGEVIESPSGLGLAVAAGPEGFGFGTVSYAEAEVEHPASSVFGLRHAETGKERRLAAAAAQRVDERTVRLLGDADVDGVLFSFDVTASLHEELPAMRIDAGWHVDRDLAGWEVCLSFHDAFANGWSAHLYPFAEDASYVAVSPLTYVGIPAALLARHDGALAVLFGFDPAFDYLNPMTWTGRTGFHFTDRVTPAQFRISAMEAGMDYRVPLQLVFAAPGELPGALTSLVRTWIKLNDWRAEPLFVRTPDQALTVFLEGRRRTSAWHPGIGYRLEEGDPESNFVYIGEQPLSAYFEYLLHERTDDQLWRRRAFEQLDFVLESQETRIGHRHYGAMHTAYDLGKGAFDSDDRGDNPGYKPDLIAHMARYLLLTWRRVKEREALDRGAWYECAVRAADWVLRQRNPDGGLPQVVDIETGRASSSHACGRSLPAMLVIAEVTGEPRFAEFAEGLERYLRSAVEARARFTGHHPDLPPDEIEEASVWGAIEYWLDTYERTGDAERLERAVADAYLAFFWWCPKQLSWVQNPTQCASAEQQHFLQYSVYCYQNRKLECLNRLGQLTGDELFRQLYRRVLQGILWTQVTEGDQMGATHERIADPWLARADYHETPSFDSLGTTYVGEQSLDAMLQLLEIGTRVS